MVKVYEPSAILAFEVQMLTATVVTEVLIGCVARFFVTYALDCALLDEP